MLVRVRDRRHTRDPDWRAYRVLRVRDLSRLDTLAPRTGLRQGDNHQVLLSAWHPLAATACGPISRVQPGQQIQARCRVSPRSDLMTINRASESPPVSHRGGPMPPATAMPATTSRPSPLRLRCPGCFRKPPPHRCQGRSSPCCCTHCHGSAIKADARARMQASNSTGLLRDSVRELLALAAQRQSRIDMIIRSEPVTVTCVVCARRVAASRFGRRRLTCSGTCRNRLWRQRNTERERQVATGELDDDLVAAGWRGCSGAGTSALRPSSWRGVRPMTPRTATCSIRLAGRTGSMSDPSLRGLSPVPAGTPARSCCSTGARIRGRRRRCSRARTRGSMRSTPRRGGGNEGCRAGW
jgi:hypothetical protein